MCNSENEKMVNMKMVNIVNVVYAYLHEFPHFLSGMLYISLCMEKKEYEHSFPDHRLNYFFS